MSSLWTYMNIFNMHINVALLIVSKSSCKWDFIQRCDRSGEKHSLRGVRRVHAARPQKHAQDAKRRAQKSRHLTVTVLPRVSRDCRTSSNKQKTCSVQQTHSCERALRVRAREWARTNPHFSTENMTDEAPPLPHTLTLCNSLIIQYLICI